MQVWPGTTVFPDFFHPNTSDYWYQHAQAYHDQVPYDGIWIVSLGSNCYQIYWKKNWFCSRWLKGYFVCYSKSLLRTDCYYWKHRTAHHCKFHLIKNYFVLVHVLIFFLTCKPIIIVFVLFRRTWMSPLTWWKDRRLVAQTTALRTHPGSHQVWHGLFAFIYTWLVSLNVLWGQQLHLRGCAVKCGSRLVHTGFFFIRAKKKKRLGLPLVQVG